MIVSSSDHVQSSTLTIARKQKINNYVQCHLFFFLNLSVSTSSTSSAFASNTQKAFTQTTDAAAFLSETTKVTKN